MTNELKESVMKAVDIVFDYLMANPDITRLGTNRDNKKLVCQLEDYTND